MGRPSVLHQKTPPVSPTTFPPRRVRFFPVFQRDRFCLKFWVISPENWKRMDSPGRESGRGRWWSLLGWRRAVAGAGGWRTDGRPHIKPSADVRFTSRLSPKTSNKVNLVGTLEFDGLAGDGKRSGKLLESAGVEAPSPAPYGGERREIRTLRVAVAQFNYFITQDLVGLDQKKGPGIL
ncbi:hypothetical protein ACLB2K_012167 [Fragaria x ananassa]